jgi:hypothetical protein
MAPGRISDNKGSWAKLKTRDPFIASRNRNRGWIMENEFERILKDEERILAGESEPSGCLSAIVVCVACVAVGGSILVLLALVRPSLALVVALSDGLPLPADKYRVFPDVLPPFWICFAFAVLPWFALNLILRLRKREETRLKLELQIVKAIMEIRERLDRGESTSEEDQ